MVTIKKICGIIFSGFILFCLGACCLGNYKCSADDNSSRFRVLSAGGTDLVFGAGRLYNKDSIRFFSLNVADTVFHHYGAGPNPNPGQDSLLFVDFDHRKYETVYLRLNNIDTDTLKLNYPLVDASPCCPDYRMAQPLIVNNRNIEQMPGGISVIKK